jgi:hypothetical protein
MQRPVALHSPGFDQGNTHTGDNTMNTLSCRAALCVLALLSLSACAVYKWAPPPGGTPLTFDQQAAQCRLYARGSTPASPGFVAASGSPAFVGGMVGGIMLASAIGQAVTTQANFNDCMTANGWVAVDKS